MIREERIQIPFTYAAGEGGSRFLRALREEARMVGTRCPVCHKVFCPARSFCPRCGGAIDEEVEVGPGGTLLLWTEVSGGGVYGLIQLDGADTAILHRLMGSGSEWRAGVRVRARFAEKRSGSILDIERFEPEGGRDS